jgi:uncharacterized protein YecT (DUF1311 family)
MAICADRANIAAEDRLNASYKRALAGLRKIDAEYAQHFPSRGALGATAGLVAAQRAWIDFRRQSCGTERLIVLSGNPSRGDYAGLAETECQSTLASARADELERLAKAYDMGAP